jgi:hypothetical protein
MVKAAGNSAPTRRRFIAPAMLVAAAIASAHPVLAQVGPIDHDGYLEYQFRLTRNEEGLGTDQHLGTWRSSASTFVWKPYILMLDGNLGLTRTRNAVSETKNAGTIVTGAVAANAFARSTFPFRLYFESRDSRVDGDIFDTDFSTRNWGFLQQLGSRRTGGRIALEYRASDTEEISVNGTTERRKYGSDLWQLTGNRAFGRNDFRLLTSLRKINRDVPAQTRDRTLVSLRHQFRGGLRFNIDDTLFYSDERLNLGSGAQLPRFLQFNGYSNWRPDTEKPLTVIGRLVAQGVEAGNGTLRGSHTYLVSGTATYQYSPHVTFAASAGFDGSGGDNLEGQTGMFQRLRGTFRSSPIPVGRMAYNWGGSFDLGNRRHSNGIVEAVQAIGSSFNHGLSRVSNLGGGRQLQLSLTQTVAALADTEDRREQSLVHTAFATYNRQRGRSSGYLRLSASDRRLYGDRRDEFQLLSLQASSRMQLNRTRSLNGGFSLQYSNSETPMMMTNGDATIMTMADRNAFTYSVNLSYFDRELFSVYNLNFLSELRYLSVEFQDDDPFAREDLFDPSRSDSSWRNELSYRIGLLELRLLAEVRDINGRWNSQAFFSVRRYYGTT